MIDPEVQAMIEIILKELRDQRDESEGIFFREEDWYIEGRLDIASLATIVIEHSKVINGLS